MQDTKIVVSEILEGFLEDVKLLKINCQDLELIMFHNIKTFLLKGSTVFQILKTVWQEVSVVLKEEM